MGDKDSSKPRVLGIDLETYSDVDLANAGCTGMWKGTSTSCCSPMLSMMGMCA